MKAILRRLKKRNSGGFTLVEVIVSCALLAVLLGGMMLFIYPVIRTFDDTEKVYTADNVANCIDEYITKKIYNARRIAIFSNANYDQLTNVEEYKNKIAEMNSFCASVNKNDPNKTYVLRCISLRYDAADGKYYLYQEEPNMTGNGVLKQDKARAVFQKCLYNDLFFTFSFSKPINGDYPTVEGSKPLRDDALSINIRAFSDSDYSNLVYSGSGITELRQIKTMLRLGQKASDFNLTVYPSVPLEFGSMVDGERDYFIFYIERQLYAKAP